MMISYVHQSPSSLQQSALTHLQRAIELNPETDSFLTRYVQLLLDCDRVAEAEAFLNAQITIDPTSPTKRKLHYYLLLKCHPDDALSRLLLLEVVAALDPCASILNDAPSCWEEIQVSQVAMATGNMEADCDAQGHTALLTIFCCMGDHTMHSLEKEFWQAFANTLQRVPQEILPFSSSPSHPSSAQCSAPSHQSSSSVIHASLKQPIRRGDTCRLLCWDDRLQWWQSAWFTNLQAWPTARSAKFAAACVRAERGLALDSAKAICAVYFYGWTNSFTHRFLQRLHDLQRPPPPPLIAVVAALRASGNSFTD